MAERLSELYKFLVSCEIPADEVTEFFRDLTAGWGAARRRKEFLQKYREQIDAGIGARSGQFDSQQFAGIFSR
jgi:hypothetical protein